MTKSFWYRFLLFSCFFSALKSQTAGFTERTAFWETESKWVDSVFSTLTTDEKLGQLFMVAAYSNKDLKHVRDVRELIEKYSIGGLIFMQGGPVRQAKLTNYYQSLAKTKLLIAIDGEWGLAMRLDSTAQYPRQMTLGAIQKDSLIYFMGRRVAEDCKRMGIHVNFAPVADVNNNPGNPVISSRSFGENKYAVSKKALLYMAGMQDHGVLASGKHFPGHGDTDSDSHFTLPIVNHSPERMDTLELYPFKQLFARKLGSVMVAHLFIPGFDTTKNQPSTLSKPIVSDLLKTKLNYQGLVFTDALNMKGASTYTTPGVMEMKALQAGNDILLFSENVPKAITEIKAAIERGEISQEEIDVRVKKILKAKYWCGLHQRQHVKLKNLEADLNSVSSARINTLLAEASVTVLQNTNNTIPLKNVNNLKIAEVSIGEESANVFSSTLQHYFHLDHYGIKHDAKAAEVDSLIRQLNTYDLLIVQVNKTSYKPANNFGLGAESQRLIQELSLSGKSIMVFFSNAYLLSKIQGLEKNKVVIEAYEYNRYSQKACAEVIAGAISASGKLPVTTGTYKYGEGIDLPHPIRVQFTTPEMLGMDSVKLKAVDSIALEGIKESCYPGCQIVALKNGKVFYRKSFGNTTYEGKEAITNNSVYDLASLTKILSSSLALMDLTGRDKLDINKPLQAYLPELKGTNKGGMQVKDVLTHQAGLPAWIPFHLNLLTKDNDYKPGYFNTQLNEQFPTRVAENLFVCKNFTDSIYNIIIASKTEKKGKYVYSDLGYYFFKKIIEKETNSGLGDFVKKTFYEPMGLYSLTYQPRNIFPLSGIVPTENDTRFRKQLIRGDVHDPGAALMGGVGGHAGLFGNASDVAILMYMLLNNGAYAGQQFLKPPVVRMFTNECLFCPGNRRGLCFDKPEPDSKKESPVTAECSLESFGHSGFTGTFAWADPANGLVYVFLSNRVHPDAEKNKLAKSNIRGRIHKAFYEAVKNERAWK